MPARLGFGPARQVKEQGRRRASREVRGAPRRGWRRWDQASCGGRTLAPGESMNVWPERFRG
eukprot:5177153-Pleurochrysis_carterae.AAC.1